MTLFDASDFWNGCEQVVAAGTGDRNGVLVEALVSYTELAEAGLVLEERGSDTTTIDTSLDDIVARFGTEILDQFFGAEG